MSLRVLSSILLPCAGLVIPPLLWALTTQAGQVLPYTDCNAPLSFNAIVTSGSVLVSMGCGLGAWRARPGQEAEGRISPQRFELIRRLSLGTATVFAFTLLLQLLASLAVSACAR